MHVLSNTSLSCGERVVRCLLGESIDRIPFGISVGWRPWDETMVRWKKQSGDIDLNPGVVFGYDAGFAKPAITMGMFPAFEHVIIRQDDEFITYRDERGITKRDRRDRCSMPEFLDYPVKVEADWERLKEERLRIDDPARVLMDWDLFRRRIRVTGEAVQVGTYPYGVFGTVRDLMGDEEMLVSFYTQPKMIRDMMEHLTTLWISVWEQVANEVQIDHIHIWEDMCGRQGSLISMDMVKEFMMPCYDRIADFAQSVGVRIISVDTDGDCRELVPVMMEHGVNTLFPFEVQAGNDILEYRRLYPSLGIIGGLDKRSLAADRAAIDRGVEKCARMLESGGYIPAFDHLIPPDVPWDNFVYAALQLKDLCYGKE
ncbi:MAG: hypothetical protein HYX78_09150 [Armatimonadetes bacterium]|nr:hypothetical protein [Armatimonadota bacterium]